MVREVGQVFEEISECACAKEMVRQGRSSQPHASRSAPVVLTYTLLNALLLPGGKRKWSSGAV